VVLTGCVRLDRLTVDHGSTGRGFSPDPLPVSHDKQVVHALGKTRVAPHHSLMTIAREAESTEEVMPIGQTESALLSCLQERELKIALFHFDLARRGVATAENAVDVFQASPLEP
jgi:hypothetical protein